MPEEPRADPELTHEPSDLTETVVRGAGLAGAGYAIGQVVTLGSFLVLARLAVPEDFGEFAAGSILVSVGLLFTESGMLAALIHRKDRIEEAANTAVVTTALGGLGFALLALAASPAVGYFFDSDRIGRIAAASSGILFLRSLLVVPEALLQRRFSFLRRVVVEPAGTAAFGVAAIIACAHGLGPWGLVIGYYASAVVDVVLSWALVGWRPRLRLASVAMWRELIAYGRFVLASNIVMRAGEQVPVLLLGRFVSAGALGQYRYADRIGHTPLSLLVQAASYVLFPAFARITEDRERFRGATLRSLRMMCALAFPLGLILVPLGVPAAVLFFGDIWKDAGYAAMALAGIPVAGTVVSFASETLKADGRPDILTRIHLVILAASVIAMVALLPFGLVGVAGGVTLGLSVGAAYATRKVALQIGLSARDLATAILPPALAATLMAGALVPVEFLVVHAASRETFPGLLALLGEGMAGLGIYGALLALISPRTARDVLDLAARILRRGKSEPAEAG